MISWGPFLERSENFLGPESCTMFAAFAGQDQSFSIIQRTIS